MSVFSFIFSFLLAFSMTKTQWRLWIKGNERHIWHFQYVAKHRQTAASIWLQSAVHADKQKDRELRGLSVSQWHQFHACWLTRQTVTHCDGSLLLHNEILGKCLIKLSFTSFSSPSLFPSFTCSVASVIVICLECSICVSAFLQVCFTLKKKDNDGEFHSFLLWHQWALRILTSVKAGMQLFLILQEYFF